MADLESTSVPALGGVFHLGEMDVELLASTLRALAKGFFFIYLLYLLRQLLPLNITNPSWFQGLITALINNSAIPLGGFGFLLLAALISPTARTVRLLLFASRWALPAAIGFLLLIPLQSFVTYKIVSRIESAANRQADAAFSQLSSLGEQITAATTPEGLQGALKGLPPPVIERAGSLPLAQAREELLAGLEQEQTTLRTRKRDQLRSLRWGGAKEAIGNILVSLVLARVLYTGRLLRLREVFFVPFPAEGM